MGNLLTPILLQGPGRSGSTLLMEILAQSNLVSFDRKYPYENRYLTYMFNFCKGLSVAEKEQEDESLMLELDSDKASMSPPFIPELTMNSKEFFRQAFFSLWGVFSDCNKKKYSANLYYAEKAFFGFHNNMRQLIPKTKLIYRVRDPRDVWLSVIGFDKKRGYFGFGRQQCEKEDAYMQKFISDQEKHLQSAIDIKRKGDKSDCVVKYEDLLLNTSTTIDAISACLGIDLDKKLPMSNFSKHATSPSPVDSVYKWKKILSHKDNECFLLHLGGLLDELGYDVGHQSARKRKIFDLFLKR